MILNLFEELKLSHFFALSLNFRSEEVIKIGLDEGVVSIGLFFSQIVHSRTME